METILLLNRKGKEQLVNELKLSEKFNPYSGYFGLMDVESNLINIFMLTIY